MPKRELAPQIGEVSPAEHKNRKRRIKRLVHQRLAFGKGTFFDTHTRKPRYPIDEISIALYKVLCKANKINKHLDLSAEEKKLWEQIFKIIVIAFALCLVCFYTDLDGDGVPDFFEYRRASPDFMEKTLGLEDDAIEKSLGFPEHSIEEFFKAGSIGYDRMVAKHG